MSQHAWETQPLAKLSPADRDAAYGNAIAAGDALKPMPINAEQDRAILKGYREGLDTRKNLNETHARHEGGTIEPREHQKLITLMRFADAVDGAMEAAATMSPKEIAARAQAERSAASGQWHEINAKESGLTESRGASQAEFDRWERQDVAAKAWGVVSHHATQREREAYAATLRPVTPRKAVEELGRYAPIAIRQLQAQADRSGAQTELQALQEGRGRRDATILQRLGNEPLSVSITPDQTPLDRVRAINSAIEQALSRTAQDERFHSAERSADRAASIGLATIQNATSRLFGRSEPVPEAVRPVERVR